MPGEVSLRNRPTKLSIEDVLISDQQLLGEEAEYNLETGGGFGRSKIRLTIPGKEADPFADTGAFFDEDVFIRNALNQMGKLPRWRYNRGKNEIIFTTDKKKTPERVKLVIAILFWFSAIVTAESEHIEVSAAWIITVLFICIVLSTAAPPVPGGMSADYCCSRRFRMV